ncbi:glycosyl transferase [Alphaproteobacteria bacterium]|nr:glycosyl transferase [Alphaproteobacteria bacterium]
MIKISIIIPVYNVEKYLTRCLDSVINQTLKEIEIICINDGSTDKSLEILNEYAARDPRIVLLNQSNTMGPSITRNKALSISNGEYIGFVDSDDWIDLNFFEELYNAAQRRNADIACASIERIYPNGKNRMFVEFPEEAVIISPTMKYKATITPRRGYVWNKIYRRSELKKHNLLFPENVYFEDMPFTIRALFFLKTLVVVPKVKYHYWVNYKSIMRTMTDRKQLDFMNARLDFINFTNNHHITCDDKYYIIQRISHRFCGITVIKIHEWKTKKKYYLFGVIKIWEILKS